MSPKKVLVIEDNELDRKLVRNLLSLDNYEVLETESAETGIELAIRHQPDLIIMDLHLPGMDGLGATRWILKDDRLKAIPIIVLTSQAMEGVRKRVLEAGCAEYITKPIDKKSFQTIIAGHLA